MQCWNNSAAAKAVAAGRAAGERIDHRLDVSPRVLKFAGRMESHMEVRAQDVDRAKVTRKAR